MRLLCPFPLIFSNGRRPKGKKRQCYAQMPHANQHAASHRPSDFCYTLDAFDFDKGVVVD
jgi:hypothetical protein